MCKMGIMFLMGILLGFMGVFMIHLKVVIIKPKPNKKTEWIMGAVFALFWTNDWLSTPVLI